jgi:hypothetical protein
MKHIQALRLLLLLLCIRLLIIPVAAQGNSEIFVTTQDYVVLRLGPGVFWERLAVLDYDLILRATGRTLDTQWIQVAYTEPLPPEASTDATIDGITYGWISADFLRWSGNVLMLPIDGVRTMSTARRAGPQLLLVPDTVYYSVLGAFSSPAGVIRNPRFVELTGRIGSSDNGYFWMQFQMDGAYYWTATWYSDPPQDYRQVLDASYLFPFGRIFNEMLAVYNESLDKLYDMSSRWNDLSAGFAATCNNIPEPVVFRFSLVNDVDIAREPVFTAPYNALALARDNVNLAISQFQAVCDRDPEFRFATPEDIEIALAAIREAQLQLNVLDILLNPIGMRHPIANND